jgi:hypothetical protein
MKNLEMITKKLQRKKLQRRKLQRRKFQKETPKLTRDFFTTK